jgi:hypothetical protein
LRAAIVRADDDAERRRDDDPEHEPDQLDLAEDRASIRRRPSCTRSCGSRCIRAARCRRACPTDGSRTSVRSRRPASTWATCAPPQRQEIDDQPLRVVEREAAGEAGTQRDAADHQGDADDPPAGAPRSSAARMDITEDPRDAGPAQGVAGRLVPVMPERARSRRIRTWPIDSSSPKPSGATDAIGRAVHVRAVRAAEVLRRTSSGRDTSARHGRRGERVLARRSRCSRPRPSVVDRSRGRRRGRASGSPRGRLDDDQAPERGPPLGAASPRSRQERSDDACEETGTRSARKRSRTTHTIRSRPSISDVPGDLDQ